MYCFRVPFTMSERSLLGITERRFDLLSGPEVNVWLTSTVEDQPLSDAERLVVRGEGFSSEAEASAEGERWRDVISRGFARVHLAADFGDRQPFGALSEAGVELFSDKVGHPVISDVPGVTTFLCDPGPVFIRSEAKGCRRPTPEHNQRVLLGAVSVDARLTEVERLAFDLYSASFFQPSADSRLLMLTMAVETLLALQPRSQVARDHVGALIESTETSPTLNPDERASILGSLRWLLDESIGQAGRRLARTLEPRRYLDLAPAKFFTRCYELRSHLVHGYVPRPSRSEVDSHAAFLEVFVGDLLSGPLLTAVPD